MERLNDRKRWIIIGICIVIVGILVVYSRKTTQEDIRMGYTQITQEEAKRIMDNDNDVVVLDVRTQEEYELGHIKGATLLPLDEIDARATEQLKNKDQTILVYCRSGKRSKMASEKLADLGYTNIKEFGGIITWEYDTEK